MSNNGLINKQEFSVKYPKKEKAYAFVPHGSIPFETAVVGMTYPSPEYEINRNERTRVCLFEYVLSGEGEVYIDGKWQTAKAGDYYILPAGRAHSYRSSREKPWGKIWINYVSEYMPKLLDAYGIKGGVYRSEKVRGYFEELLELTR